MASILRDTAVGAVIRRLTKNKSLQYPEEKPDFKLPEVWQQVLDAEDSDDDVTIPDAEKRSVLGGTATNNTSNLSMAEDRDVVSNGIRTADTDVDDDQTANDVDDEKGDETADEDPYSAMGPIGAAHSAGTGPAHAAGPHLALHHTRSREETLPYTDERLQVDEEHNQDKHGRVDEPVVPRRVRLDTRAGRNQSVLVVDWYSTRDPENPTNWTNGRRAGVTFLICLYTFVVYTSSAIYTTSEEGVMETFGVDATHAALGLSLFVLGYGIGPLLFSPLSEIPVIGRNPVYAVTMVLFVVVSLPTALAYGNLEGGRSSGAFGGLMVLRFLQGFFGSPCLASGAATMGDMYSGLNLPFALVAWVSAAYCGPALGPLLSGFSVPAMGWRWSLLEILWASAPIALLMIVLLPETSGETILLHRAQRLRKATGSDRFRAPSEIPVQLGGTAKNAKFSAVLVDALIKPIEITIKDPAILFVQIYTAIIYGIYYSFFEAFPLVYPAKYGMSYGQVGLVFLCILVANLIGVAIYCSYIYFYLNPRIRAAGRFPVQENRLVPALFASFGPTIGLFIFAWTSNSAPQVPWIAPTIGITIFGSTVFVVMQCVFVYVPLSYPQYAASLFAGNDFFRSALACGSVLFGRPLYRNLGVGRGTTLLAGLSTIGIMGIWLLYFYGARLRAMSKFATKN